VFLVAPRDVCALVSRTGAVISEGRGAALRAICCAGLRSPRPTRNAATATPITTTSSATTSSLDLSGLAADARERPRGSSSLLHFFGSFRSQAVALLDPRHRAVDLILKV